MVHNGIEYAAMAANSEGLNILKNTNAGAVKRDADAETAPMESSQFYRYNLHLASVTEVWRRGRVISSWLGEGRWTAIAAIEEGVPAPVLSTALSSRFDSRDLDHFANQVLSAMRKGFGGHDEKPVG